MSASAWEPGELVALTGPSGSARPRCCSDREPRQADSGSIFVDDIPVHALKHPAKFRRDMVGFVFQLHHLLPSLTVQQNVELTMVAARVVGASGPRAARSCSTRSASRSARRTCIGPLGWRAPARRDRARAGRTTAADPRRRANRLTRLGRERPYLGTARRRARATRHDDPDRVARPSLLEHSDRGIAIADGRVTVPRASDALDREEVA